MFDSNSSAEHAIDDRLSRIYPYGDNSMLVGIYTIIDDYMDYKWAIQARLNSFHGGTTD